MDDRDQARFWAKVERTEGCWNWTAGTTHGYGLFWLNGGMRRAARLAYELEVGPILSGLQIDHLCRNRACVNPAHLEPVTNRENSLRGEGIAAQGAARTHCLHGHVLNGRRGDGTRYCRTCNHLRVRAYQQRNPEKYAEQHRVASREWARRNAKGRQEYKETWRQQRRKLGLPAL